MTESKIFLWLNIIYFGKNHDVKNVCSLRLMEFKRVNCKLLNYNYNGLKF